MKTKNKNQKPFVSVSTALVISVLFALNTNTTQASEISNKTIVDLTNKERELRGLNPLNVDPTLCQAATLKSNNMIALNYFEHFAHGLSPWVIIKNAGYDYQYAGENLAMDFVTSEGVVSAWMRSADHRKNILNPNFEDVCVGIAKGSYSEADNSVHNTIMVTQMFGKKKPVILSVASQILYRLFGIYSR